MAVAVLIWWWALPGHHPLVALAQAPAAPEPSVLAQYGPGGVIAGVALWLMWLERQRANRADDQVSELNRIVREMVVPALTQTRDALGQATTATTAALEAMRREPPP